MNWIFQPGRSKDWYDDESEGDSTPSSSTCSEILLYPISLVFGILLIYIVPILIIVGIVGYLLNQGYQCIKPRIACVNMRSWLYIFVAIMLTALILIAVLSGCNTPTPTEPAPTEPPIVSEPASSRTIHILMDDFKPQPYQGNSVYFYNRLEGDRGALNDSMLDWGVGQVKITIAAGQAWGGMWMSLNHPIREGLPIDFSPLLPKYQTSITGVEIQIAEGTPHGAFRVELKNGNDLVWKEQTTLSGGSQTLYFHLPALQHINHIVFVLDQARGGDYVVLQRVSFTSQMSVEDTATDAFVWSYGMLLANWNPATGLVRDKAKDASGEFDAIQATGSLAAATAVAHQLGIIDKADAIQIVNKTGEALLNDAPRYHGLLPHWVKYSSDGKLVIVENTEWSSVDTVIAVIGLLEAQSALGLDTSGAEQLLREIDWNNLVMPSGISHGYTYNGDLIPYAWDAFGGESWLVQLAYASAKGQVAPLAYPSPPTANGSGFIDELAWLYVPPPSAPDYWGTDWTSYRAASVNKQISYYPSSYSTSCFARLGLFGLSAGEVPAPAMVPQNNIYQAYGVGGAFAPTNDGSQHGTFVVAPHYSAMAASLRPEEAIAMWDWLIANGFFSPMNNVESLAFPEAGNCDPAAVEWNQLKGSWNLSLQTLGWGRYLAERNGQTPILWQAVETNPLLHKGYALLSAGSPTSPILTPANLPTPTPGLWSFERECEHPDNATVGNTINRSNASGLLVHGQFGTVPAWPPQSGYVQYDNISLSQTGELYVKLRYSKHSPTTIPIFVFLDDEQSARAAINPSNQGDWNIFAWTEPIPLGSVDAGVHSIKFYTDGQQYGVADLDKFVLFSEP